MLNRVLDIAKENYSLYLVGENGEGNIDIINRGIKSNSKGMYEEYTVVRWISEVE